MPSKPTKFKTSKSAVEHLTQLGWSIVGKSEGDITMTHPQKSFYNVIGQKAKGGWSILPYGTVILDKGTKFLSREAGRVKLDQPLPSKPSAWAAYDRAISTKVKCPPGSDPDEPSYSDHPSGLSGEHDVVLDAIQEECLGGN